MVLQSLSQLWMLIAMFEPGMNDIVKFVSGRNTIIKFHFVKIDAVKCVSGLKVVIKFVSVKIDAVKFVSCMTVIVKFAPGMNGIAKSLLWLLLQSLSLLLMFCTVCLCYEWYC